MKFLSRLGLLALALSAAACSNDSTPAAPTTTATTTTSAPATTCTYALSATRASIGAAGGNATVTVTTAAGCAWTATTSSSFITILAGSTGSGTGTVVLSVASASGVDRTDTVTIAGQTFTVSQAGAGLVQAFNLFDPASQGNATTTCRFRGATGNTTSTCQLASTSYTLGPNSIIWYIWKVQYTYAGVPKTLTQAGTSTTFSFGDVCGQTPSSAAGTVSPLSAQLTIIDSNGNQATATSGAGNQLALNIVAFTCGS